MFRTSELIPGYASKFGYFRRLSEVVSLLGRRKRGRQVYTAVLRRWPAEVSGAVLPSSEANIDFARGKSTLNKAGAHDGFSRPALVQRPYFK